MTPPIIPQVTLTLVPNVKKKKDPIVVTLDSDEEIDQSSESQREASSGNKSSVDLITVSDDEEDDVQLQVNAEVELVKENETTTIKKNGANICVNETVSIIDSDSDTETIVDKQIKVAEEKTKELTDIIENMVAMETVPETATDDKDVMETSEKNIESNDSENKEGNEGIENISENIEPEDAVVNGEVSNDTDINEEADKDENVNTETANDKDINKEGNTDEDIIEEAINDKDLNEEPTKSLDRGSNGMPSEKEPEKDKSVEKILPIASRVESSNDSIVIDDSDDEMEKENHCENVDIEPFPVSMDKTSASDVPGPSECLKVGYLYVVTR